MSDWQNAKLGEEAALVNLLVKQVEDTIRQDDRFNERQKTLAEFLVALHLCTLSAARNGMGVDKFCQWLRANWKEPPVELQLNFAQQRTPRPGGRTMTKPATKLVTCVECGEPCPPELLAKYPDIAATGEYQCPSCVEEERVEASEWGDEDE